MGTNDADEDHVGDEYSNLWSEIQQEALVHQQIARELLRRATDTIDLANLAIQIPRPAREQIPHDNYENILEATRNYHSHLQHIADIGGGGVAFPVSFPVEFAAFGTAYYSAKSGVASAIGSVLTLGTPYADDIEPVYRQMVALSENSGDRKRVLELLSKFGFDQNVHSKQAIQQFEAAWDVHSQGPSTTSASLLPLRGSLDGILGRLNNQVPKDKRGKQIIIALGQYAALDGVTAQEFQTLQAQYDALYDKLSKSDTKQGYLSRIQERALMDEATTILLAILTALDAVKIALPKSQASE